MSAVGDSVSIRPVAHAEATARLDELAEVLVDAVAGGASVNFLAGFDLAGGVDFWRGQLPGIADGSRVLLVAEDAGRIVGTIILTLSMNPNSPHRAAIGKMLVHSTRRRRGIGARLLAAVEETALAGGRTLLILDTETGSTGEKLYASCGWQAFGVVPDYALTTDGRPAPCTFFYKQLLMSP